MGSCRTQANVIHVNWYEAVVVMGALVRCWFGTKSAEWSDASFLQTTKERGIMKKGLQLKKIKNKKITDPEATGELGSVNIGPVNP